MDGRSSRKTVNIGSEYAFVIGSVQGRVQAPERGHAPLTPWSWSRSIAHQKAAGADAAKCHETTDVAPSYQDKGQTREIERVDPRTTSPTPIGVHGSLPIQ